MTLAELMDGLIDDSSLLENTVDVKGIALDSRKVKKGFVFIAVAGAIQHGLVFLQQAEKNGACAVIFDPLGSEQFAMDQLPIDQLAVEDLGLKLGKIAARFYQLPSQILDVIGVTGTNGKTSCSQFLLQLIPKCGIIGTLGWGDNSGIKETVNTTPDAIDVQAMLAEFVALKKQTVVMEVSSHGLQQGRVNEVDFKAAVFTNLSRDHLDYHGSMEAYLEAKLALFKQPNLQFVVVNADDEYSERFLAVVNNKVKPWAFSGSGKKLESAENVTADKVEFSLNGIGFLVCWGNERARIQTSIVGDYNLENILTVITVLIAQGISLTVAAKKVSMLVPVKGRMESFGGGEKPYVFVDYAHTPDALEKVLQGLRQHCQRNLWLVFGCGGNRDKGKRAQMGEIAENLADQVMITNDNPRFEDAKQIVNDILLGCTNKDTQVIYNRVKAIQTVIKKAQKNDCIVIAGKGHEEYQDINGVKQAFSDRAQVKQALKEWQQEF